LSIYIGYALRIYYISSTSNIQSIGKMYCSYWESPGVSERVWSVNLDASISGKYQTEEGVAAGNESTWDISNL